MILLVKSCSINKHLQVLEHKIEYSLEYRSSFFMRTTLLYPLYRTPTIPLVHQYLLFEHLKGLIDLGKSSLKLVLAFNTDFEDEVVCYIL